MARGRLGIAPQLTPWQRSLAAREQRVYSQSYQDGVLQAIFEAIGVPNPYYVEFGFNSQGWAGTGANTANLRKHNWRGLLMDGSNHNESINLHAELLGPHGITSLLAKYSVPEDLGYMSIDIDSFDLWTFRTVCSSRWRPRVFTVEYSPLFPLDSMLTAAWRETDSFWNESQYGFVGASLGALDAVARECGYTLVYVITGLDAVFVRSDVLRARKVAATPLLELPAERLVDWVHGFCDTKPRAHHRAATLGGRSDNVGVGGLGIKCKWAPRTWWSIAVLEDYGVFARSNDHCAARDAAARSPFARALLGAAYRLYEGNLTNAARLGTFAAAVQSGIMTTARERRRRNLSLSGAQLDAVHWRALAALAKWNLDWRAFSEACGNRTSLESTQRRGLDNELKHTRRSVTSVESRHAHGRRGYIKGV